MAVTIVELAFLRIAQDVVGLGSLLELPFRFVIADVAIRVILHGQLAIGLLECFIVGLFGNSKDLVKISLTGHRHNSTSRFWPRRAGERGTAPRSAARR